MRIHRLVLVAFALTSVGCGPDVPAVARTAPTTSLVPPVAVASLPSTPTTGPPTTTTVPSAAPLASAPPASIVVAKAEPPQVVDLPDPEPSAPAPTDGSTVNGYPCGGDLPPCWVLQRESRGDPEVWNGGCHNGPCPGGSTASGLWQFLRSTWAGFGGYDNAADAPADVQNERAREVWAGGAGCSHWSAC